MWQQEAACHATQMLVAGSSLAITVPASCEMQPTACSTHSSSMQPAAASRLLQKRIDSAALLRQCNIAYKRFATVTTLWPLIHAPRLSATGITNKNQNAGAERSDMSAVRQSAKG